MDPAGPGRAGPPGHSASTCKQTRVFRPEVRVAMKVPKHGVKTPSSLYCKARPALARRVTGNARPRGVRLSEPVTDSPPRRSCGTRELYTAWKQRRYKRAAGAASGSQPPGTRPSRRAELTRIPVPMN
ncbi:hypothetical protein AOLI_G00152380, partial [Acnodon oligacanthus]